MKRETKTFIRVFLGMAVMFGIYFGYSFGIRPLLNWSIPALLDTIINLAVMYIIGLGALLFIIKGMPSCKVNTPEKLKPITYIKCAVVQSGCFVVAMLLNIIIMKITGSTPKSTIDLSSPQMIFILLVFNPIMEELVFRKIILDKLRSLGEIKSILLSALLFALPHIFSVGIPSACYVFLMSIVWAWIANRTGRLLPVIVLHAFSNLWGGILPTVLASAQIGSAILILVWGIIVPAISTILIIKCCKNKRIKIS
jgi:membrane protease YdiL (CAAX protease family)